VFRRAREAGDIYFGQYSGWYNTTRVSSTKRV
jgi:hypothetical protein